MHSKSAAFRWLTLTAVFAAALFVIVILSRRFYIPEKNVKESGKVYDKYYVIITDEYRSSFWQSVCDGAKAQAEEMNAYVELLGNELTETHSSEELMEMAIASDVDGIMLCGVDTLEMSMLINEATAKGIPVVTIYHDNAASRRISYVGVSSYNIGSEYGRQIINVLNEKRRRAASAGTAGEDAEESEGPEEVRITVLSDPEIVTDQNVIISGIWDVLNSGDQGAVFSIDSLSVDDSNPFSVEEKLRDFFMNEEQPDIMICLSELDTTSAYQAVVDYNKVGNIYILGSYDSEKILNEISRNVVFCSISVDTEELGKYGIEALREYGEIGNTSEYFTADIILIDKSNISDYMKQEEEDEP